MKNLTSNNYSLALLVLRIGLGVVFIAHGGQKMFGWWGGDGFQKTVEMMSQGGFPTALVYLAIIAEFFGGLGVLVGAMTRLAAFGIFCTMAVAIAKAHWAGGFFMQNKGFEYPYALLMMAVALMIAGAGQYSIDYLVKDRLKSTESIKS